MKKQSGSEMQSNVTRRINMRKLRHVLMGRQQATKPELAQITGLSVVTVNALITRMLEWGEVTEEGTVPSNGGRPCAQFAYHYGFRKAVIVCAHQERGMTVLRTFVADLSGKRLWERRDVKEEIAIDSFDEAIDEATRLFPDALLIAFGLPGEAWQDEVSICDFQTLTGTEFLPRIRERYQLPVLFENDINAMVYGFGVGPGHSPFEPLAGIYFPGNYRPGAGILIGGRLFYGTEHFAGEIGELPVPFLWEELDYGNEEQVEEQLTALLLTVCCLIAPKEIVLYGEFVTDALAGRLEDVLAGRLKRSFRTKVTASYSLQEDFEKGMTGLAVREMESRMDDLA